MGKTTFKLFFTVLIFCAQVTSFAQKYNLDFGKVSSEDLSPGPHKIDPGADAVVLSEQCVASLNYSGSFYIDLEINTKLKIINSDGFDYANFVFPFYSSASLKAYRASVYNLRNGNKTETKVSKKEFLIENVSSSWKALRLAAPDVHEGSVIEFACILTLEEEALYALIPWEFQKEIPVVFSSFTFSYPEFFRYKNFISGNPRLVKFSSSTKRQYLEGREYDVITSSWYAQNVPALISEPYSKGLSENQTVLTFELGSVEYFGTRTQEITPTYKTLNEKLLKRDDFGLALSRTDFLNREVKNITKGLNDDLSKLKAIHSYLSKKILWNGIKDYTSSGPLRKVFYREKGNSADINMILIAMLRSAGIRADPVILSTRSNGTISQISAMVQQYNYLVARVVAGGEIYLVDATEPLSPFNLLPFDCLNGKGWLVSQYESGFIDLYNSEKRSTSVTINLELSDDGKLSGVLTRRHGGYAALDIRKKIKREGVEGYFEILQDQFPEYILSDIKISNLQTPDSDLVETCNILISNGVPKTGDNYFFNPFLSFLRKGNVFSSPERQSPVDFGCPLSENYSVSLKIPDKMKILEIPGKAGLVSGNKDATWVLNPQVSGKTVKIDCRFQINKTSFAVNEYEAIRNFFTRIRQNEESLIVMK